MSTPELAAPPPLPSGPVCSHAGCTGRVVAQWRRRPTDGELDAHVALEETRREERLLLADPQLPPPVFPPLPSAEDTVIAVFACARHAIDIDLASRVHAADCRAPHEEHLPVCDCEPEPLPESESVEETVTLPTGWIVPAA